MNKLLLATTCALGMSAAPAFAQNLSNPKSAPPTAYSWTGCYVGGFAGAGFAQVGFADQFLTTGDNGSEPPSSPSAHRSGGVIGAQGGCDYQFSPHWVIGGEGMFAWADLKGSSDPFFGGKAVFNAEKDWIASATGRFGYAQDRWFVYGKGGLAWVGDKYSVPGTFADIPFDYGGSETRMGWTIGAGVEYALSQHLSLVGEYNYYDFGTRSLLLVDTFGGGGDEASIKQKVETVTLGLSWRF